MLARSVADSARIDSDHSPVREADTRARLAAVIAELSAAVRAYGQLLETDPVSAEFSAFAAEPITEALEDHLEEAQRQQDQLADLLSTDPAERPEGWQLRGEILAHVDRLRSELEPGRLPDISDPARAKPPLRTLRDRARSDMHWSDRHQGERHRETGQSIPGRGGSRTGLPCGSGPGARRRESPGYLGSGRGGAAYPRGGPAYPRGGPGWSSGSSARRFPGPPTGTRPGREAHRLVHPDRGEGTQVEIGRARDRAVVRLPGRLRRSHLGRHAEAIPRVISHCGVFCLNGRRGDMP